MTAQPSSDADIAHAGADTLFKGLPDNASHLTAAPVSALASGFMWPVAVIHDCALRGNAELMAEVCKRFGIAHAPHLKTTMSPELAQLQTSHGAWGFTVGSPSQLRHARAWGMRRLVLATESLDTEFLRWVRRQLEDDPQFEFYLFIDSVVGAQVAGRHLAGVGSQVGMLIEIGHPGGRAGVRDAESAHTVARAAVDAGLSIAGIAGYEGTVGAQRTTEVETAVTAYLRRLRAMTEELDAAGMLGCDRDSVVVSCGGSTFFDLVAEELGHGWALTRPVTTVLRSGCYLLHDHEFYASSSPSFSWSRGLRPALEVWAQVISRPEAQLAILNAGRRDIGFDLGLPIPLRVIDPHSGAERTASGTITELNDQHAYLEIPLDFHLSVGDVVALGLSHPCTTMDKWRALPVIDADNRVVRYVHTYF
ncbi:hypothetical protein A5784_25370 [Mycobacterium sp. 852013-50091_SCH5140682]|uniref:alanine racemase n=1 Tax=Mycobacterium sp. 852013-50091_SCH5140682 TaxID=1834109 RepID=UPI0007EB1C4A|nr:alanine racemase [Mycobacterium sp. 852013-50091_SCH5140682]OBC16865.1 hypothetical protein A5784_25370 [Mycobacterium sp. 852013-50091_SCH5140682]